MGVFSLIKQVTATAFLFPGQGSQQVGMAQSVAAAYPAARAALDEADAVLGFALSRLMAEGPEAELTDTINAQPALLAASVAIMRALEAEFGDRASGSGGQQVFVAGHSLGEYTALVAAGSLTYADALRLVRERGRLMKEAGERSPGMMAAVLGLDEATISRVCAETTAGVGVAEIANDNTHGQVVISGDRAGMEAAMAALSAAGAKRVMPLAVSIAAHSRLMQPVAAQLQVAIDAAPLVAPAVPVIGNTTGLPLTTVDEIRCELGAQLTGSVRWTATIQWLEAAGVTTFVEIGPGEVLSGLVKRTARGAKRVNVAEAEQVADSVLKCVDKPQIGA